MTIAQLALRTKALKEIAWHENHFGIANSWCDQEGKIGNVYGYHYCASQTGAASMTRNAA